jgi:hypothetical protein
MPHDDQEREAVREALSHILSSSYFCNSKRYPALLGYVVEQTLNGHGDQIKERTVGVEALGRAPDYDTNADTIVRYTAGEVRKRLALYYRDAPDEPIQISLSARSYLPEFFRLSDESGEQAGGIALHEPSKTSVSANAPASGSSPKRLKIAALALVSVCVMLTAFWVWSAYRDRAINRFWSPVLRAKGPVLISPGGVVFSSTSEIGTQVANSTVPNPFLSFENGLAMGRVAALLNSKGASYRMQSSALVSLAQFRDDPVVLIGAYNNRWSQLLLAPLRFHFAPHPEEQIVDAAHPGKLWMRDISKPYSETPDYALVARFRNPSTDSIVVVVAGLQRYGTDAASQFIVSANALEELSRRVGSGWENKNLEVVLKVDVVDGRVGAPIIEAVHSW